ncbi:MAG: glycerol kinase GlpK [Gammaproteobacteria bacterium]|nr:glycerol kinase GlpK [Gammaproteobacteria bacterium]
MKYLLAIDQGTTSSRAVLFDKQGRVVATGQKEFKQYFPQSGWVEHDATEIWQSVLEVIDMALAKANASIQEVTAIGITNQRETTVVWHRQTGQPIGHAIVWQDRRSSEICQNLQHYSQFLQEKTGLLLDPYFSATKLCWLLHHNKQVHDLAKIGELAFGTIDSWLVWCLTQGRSHITDVSNASRTMLMDLHTQQWDEELLKIFQIPPSLLPTIVNSAGVLASTHPAVLGDEIPITAILGDQQAALFGQRCLQPGQAKCTLGTGSFLLLNTGTLATYSQHRLISTIAWKTPDRLQFALEGSVFMAGALLNWLKDDLGLFQNWQEMEDMVRSTPDVQDLVLVPAFTGLGAPHWDAKARGLLIGLSRECQKRHIVRAAMEAIGLQNAEVFQAMMDDARLSIQQLFVDGGVSKSDSLMQIQADLLNLPVYRPQNTESTASGIAYLAGLTVGFWQSEEEIAQFIQIDQIFYPQKSAHWMKDKQLKWLEAVEKSKGWIV